MSIHLGVVNSTWVTSKVSVQKPRTGKWRIVKGRTAKSWCSVSLVQLDNSNKSDDPHNVAHWPHWNTDWQTLPFLIRSRKAWQCLMGWLPSSFWLTTIRKQCRNHRAKLKHAQTMRINQISFLSNLSFNIEKHALPVNYKVCLPFWLPLIYTYLFQCYWWDWGAGRAGLLSELMLRRHVIRFSDLLCVQGLEEGWLMLVVEKGQGKSRVQTHCSIICAHKVLTQVDLGLCAPSLAVLPPRAWSIVSRWTHYDSLNLLDEKWQHVFCSPGNS